MPASLPGDTYLNNAGNPNAGAFVTFDALSGPKGSPFDNDKQVDIVTGAVTNSGNHSTGAMSTGIGMSCGAPIMGPGVEFNAGSPSLLGFNDGNFTDDYVPGQSSPDSVDDKDSTIVYIGGGRMIKDSSYPSADHTELFIPSPYATGVANICGAGNGGSRDSGANTGFGMKTVTLATGSAANGAAVEAGWVNRSGATVEAGQTVFGSATVANVAPS